MLPSVRLRIVKARFFFVTIKIFPAIVTTNQRNLSLLTTQLRIAQNLLRRQLDGDLVLCCILMDLSFSLVRKLKKKKRKNTRLSSSRVDWMIGYQRIYTGIEGIVCVAGRRWKTRRRCGHQWRSTGQFLQLVTQQEERDWCCHGTRRNSCQKWCCCRVRSYEQSQENGLPRKRG